MLRIRAFFLVALGMPVMAAMLSAGVTLMLRLAGTPMLDRGFWIGSAVMGVLCLAALGLILTIRSRVLKTGETGALALLARYSPVLMILGAVGGGVFGHLIAESALVTHQRVMEIECRDFVGDDQPIDACLPVMALCDAEVRDTDGLHPDRDGKLPVEWPDGLAVPDNAKSRARHLCAWKAMNGP